MEGSTTLYPGSSLLSFLLCTVRVTLDMSGVIRKGGDLVINIASMPITERGQSNMMKLSMVN